MLSRKGWVTAHWVPRKNNEQADMISKSSPESWDFGIKPDVAEELFKHFFAPQLDIFASHTFCDNYYACGHDRAARRSNAFLVANWPDYSDVFPPPPLVSKTLTKIEDNGITVIVTPRWTLSLG